MAKFDLRRQKNSSGSEIESVADIIKAASKEYPGISKISMGGPDSDMPHFMYKDHKIQAFAGNTDGDIILIDYGKDEDKFVEDYVGIRNGMSVKCWTFESGFDFSAIRDALEKLYKVVTNKDTK